MVQSERFLHWDQNSNYTHETTHTRQPEHILNMRLNVSGTGPESKHTARGLNGLGILDTGLDASGTGLGELDVRD